MPRIVRFHETGPPEVLRIEDLPDSPPGEGEVRLNVETHRFMESNRHLGKILVTV